MSKRLIVLVIVIVLPLLPVILVVRQSSSSLSRTTERAAQLSPLNGAQLRDLADGTEVLIEGVIDPRTPAQYQTLVAYEQQYSLVDNDLGRYWQSFDQSTPPLWITLPDGQSVQIRNSDYQLRHTTVQVDGPANSYGRPTRYLGLQTGNRVTVLGRVASTAEGLALNAEVVAGGLRTTWLSDEGGISPAILDGLLIAGLAVSVVGLVAWWLAQHHHRPSLPAGV